VRVASGVHNKKDERQQSQAAARESLTGYRAKRHKWLNTGKGHLVKLHNPCLGEFRTPAEENLEQLDPMLRAEGLQEIRR